MLRFLTKLPELFIDLFNAAKRAWHKLSPEIQSALVSGSGVIAVINVFIAESPRFIMGMMQRKFPHLTVEQLQGGLFKIAEGLNIAEGINSDDLETLIGNLQSYLKQHQGTGEKKSKVWAILSHTAAIIFSIFLAPQAKVASVTQMIEYGYQEHVKEDIQAAA